MSRRNKEVWVCDFPECGYEWWKPNKRPPLRCAGCKKKNWDKYVGDPNLKQEAAPAAQPKIIIVSSRQKCPICSSTLQPWGTQKRCPKCERNY